jgi:hypothetical protein
VHGIDVNGPPAHWPPQRYKVNTVGNMFAGIPITGWLLGRYLAASWRSRTFAVEYVLSLGTSSFVIPMMVVLHESGYGFDRQYLLFAMLAGVVAVGALALPKSGSLDAKLVLAHRGIPKTVAPTPARMLDQPLDLLRGQVLARAAITVEGETRRYCPVYSARGLAPQALFVPCFHEVSIH